MFLKKGHNLEAALQYAEQSTAFKKIFVHVHYLNVTSCYNIPL